MANLSIGIVGLPNVGKSTLFRALTSVAVPAENYPFCTIDPNVGVVEVPDERLWRLAEIVPAERVEPTVVEFVDIAGLVEGASRGEGLGNQFLQHIREVDAVAHVIRCFEDDRVARPTSDADPMRDREVVEAELALADLDVVERRRERVAKKARTGTEGAEEELELLDRVHDALERGVPARLLDLDDEERKRLQGFQLLTMKPLMYVLNVDEEALDGGSSVVEGFESTVRSEEPGAICVRVAARLEAEVAELPEDERRVFLEAHGLDRSGLDRLVRAGYRLLGLQTFFTWNDEELRAWTVRAGACAPEAAGRVHTDFEKGFIRAETIAWDAFLEVGSMKRAREEGRVRSEGKDYVVEDGDILLFRANP